MQNIDELVSQIKVMKSNPHYRIGDLFYMKGFRWKSDREVVLKNPEFKNTIMRKYLRRMKKEKDFVLLKSIVNEVSMINGYELPKSDELVIHIRSGDVIDKSNALKPNFINNIGNIIKEHDIQKITIVTAMHYGDYKEKDLWLYTNESYVNNITKLKQILHDILELNRQVSVKSGDIDEDFAYLANAKYLVVDNGGYGKLAMNVKNINPVK